MLSALLISFRRVDLQSGDQRDVSDAIPDVSESAREDLKGEAELPAEGVAECRSQIFDCEKFLNVSNLSFWDLSC